MAHRSSPDIATYLTDEVARERVRQSMYRVREEAMVTIGEAARLFGFSESQLRDWEKLGLLKPVRPVEGAEDSRNVRKQRQYSFEELDKLAIIQELLNNSDLTLGMIAQNIKQLQRALFPIETLASSAVADYGQTQDATQHEQRYIVQRMEVAYQQVFWRHYASHVLFLAIKLLYEDLPGTSIGLILPVDGWFAGGPLPNSERLPDVGEALIGWFGQTRSFYTFLTLAPEFEFPSDFLIRPLLSASEQIADGSFIASPIFVAVQRGKEKRLNVDADVVRLVRRLLVPLYEDKQNWHSYFGRGMHDQVYPGMDFSSNVPDALLTSLVNMVVRLGGKTPLGEDRWRFSCILLPDTTNLPLRQRKLIVRAASKNASQLEEVVIVPTDRYGTSLSLRAFMSSHIVYRSRLTREDTTPVLSQLEGPVLSNIAVPIGGEIGQPLGILYVASYHVAAFVHEDQSLLRFICRLAEDILRTYEVRQQITRDLDITFARPAAIDTLFEKFPSEDDFVNDIEKVLSSLQEQTATQKISLQNEQSFVPVIDAQPEDDFSPDVVSFLAVELDDQNLDKRFAELLVRNVNFRVGELIERQFRALFTLSEYKLPYHIYGSRFYLCLKDVSLVEARKKAKELKNALDGSYMFDSLYTSTKQLTPLARAVELPGITACVGVASYPYAKLGEIMQRYYSYTSMEALAAVRNIIINFLDELLDRGRKKGGNVVMSWDRVRYEIIQWSPPN